MPLLVSLQLLSVSSFMFFTAFAFLLIVIVMLFFMAILLFLVFVVSRIMSPGITMLISIVVRFA